MVTGALGGVFFVGIHLECEWVCRWGGDVGSGNRHLWLRWRLGGLGVHGTGVG